MHYAGYVTGVNKFRELVKQSTVRISMIVMSSAFYVNTHQSSHYYTIFSCVVANLFILFQFCFIGSVN